METETIKGEIDMSKPSQPLFTKQEILTRLITRGRKASKAKRAAERRAERAEDLASRPPKAPKLTPEEAEAVRKRAEEERAARKSRREQGGKQPGRLVAMRPVLHRLKGRNWRYWTRGIRRLLLVSESAYKLWETYHVGLKTNFGRYPFVKIGRQDQYLWLSKSIGISLSAAKLAFANLIDAGLAWKDPAKRRYSPIRVFRAVANGKENNFKEIEKSWEEEIRMGVPAKLFESLKKVAVQGCDLRAYNGRGEYTRGANLISAAYVQMREDVHLPFPEPEKSRRNFFAAAKALQDLDIKHIYFRDYVFYAQDAFRAMMTRKGMPNCVIMASHLKSQGFINQFINNVLGGRVLDYVSAEELLEGRGYREACIQTALRAISGGPKEEERMIHPEVIEIMGLLKAELGPKIWTYKVDQDVRVKLVTAEAGERAMAELVAREKAIADEWEAGAEAREAKAAEEARVAEETRLLKFRKQIEPYTPTEEAYRKVAEECVTLPDGPLRRMRLMQLRAFEHVYGHVLREITARIKAEAAAEQDVQVAA